MKNKQTKIIYCGDIKQANEYILMKKENILLKQKIYRLTRKVKNKKSRKEERRIKQIDRLLALLRSYQHILYDRMRLKNPPEQLKELRGILLEANFSQITLCGIYFLIGDMGEVVYVGQSVNIIARIRSHRRDKIFKKVYFFHVEPINLDKTESLWIDKILPPLNNCSRSRLLKKHNTLLAKS